METKELASALRNMISAMGKRLRKTVHSIDNFSLSEMDTLSHLYPDYTLSPTELAKLVLVKTQSMSELLVRLKNLDIIQREPSETDKRKSLVSLTEQGKFIVEKTRYERDEWLTQAIDETLSASEKLILQQAIELIGKIKEYQ